MAHASLSEEKARRERQFLRAELRLEPSVECQLWSKPSPKLKNIMDSRKIADRNETKSHSFGVDNVMRGRASQFPHQKSDPSFPSSATARLSSSPLRRSSFTSPAWKESESVVYARMAGKSKRLLPPATVWEGPVKARALAQNLLLAESRARRSSGGCTDDDVEPRTMTWSRGGKTMSKSAAVAAGQRPASRAEHGGMKESQSSIGITDEKGLSASRSGSSLESGGSRERLEEEGGEREGEGEGVGEEDEVEGEEEEPYLKYERLGGNVPEIVDENVVTCCCLSDRMVVLGTQDGAVHVLDVQGNRVSGVGSMKRDDGASTISFNSHRASRHLLREQGDWGALAP